MFKWFEKSPEESYKEALKEKRIEAIKCGDFIVGYEEKRYKTSFDYNYIKWREEYKNFLIIETDTEWIIYDTDIINFSFNNPLLNENLDYKEDYIQKEIDKFKRDMEIKKQEAEQERAMIIQEKKDEEYLNKLKALLEIRPLDSDLQEAINKTKEILSLGEQISKIQKRINFLRK